MFDTCGVPVYVQDVCENWVSEVTRKNRRPLGEFGKNTNCDLCDLCTSTVNVLFLMDVYYKNPN